MRRGLPLLAAGAVKAQALQAHLVLLLLLAGLLALAPAPAAAQGLRSDTDKLGGSETRNILKSWFNWGRWAPGRYYGNNNCRQGGSLCGSDMADKINKDHLQSITSPPVYDLRIADHNGGFVAAPPRRDVRSCNAGGAMAVAAAADVAIAKATQRELSGPEVSAYQIMFCGDIPANDLPNCSQGMTPKYAVDVLVDKMPYVRTEECMPFVSEDDADDFVADDTQMCASSCSDVVEGKLETNRVNPFDNPGEIQKFLREDGGVVTTMWVPDDFREFYEDPKNKELVWGKNATGDGRYEGVAIVGYNNKDRWWLLWFPWGSDWGDGGYARVKYGVLDIAEPGNVWGIRFTPTHQPAPLPSVKPSGPKDAKGCQTYVVTRTTYLSKVAGEIRVSLAALVKDNQGRIPDMTDWLKPGTPLKACTGGAGR